ncbi:MAG TPA: PP2C family protein-serine/threonine phosphatase [Terracidiphilus sp.]|nr:PP2C family protein-serine/threonine phosphatase [Terracidiphilus sp.]
MRRCARFALLLAAAVATSVAQSQAAAVRYHTGDNPAWASPAFDDSSWPIAQQGRWPQPAFHSDGFVWVRLLVPVRSDTAEPLALHVTDLTRAWMADEVFVNGVRVGAFGSLPPAPFVPGLPLDSAFQLPPGLTHPGAVARVALRIWYPPYARMSRAPAASQPAGTAPPSGGATAVETMKKQSSGFDAMSLAFDQSRTLQAEQAALSDEARLRNILPITLNCFILLIGLAILLLARSSRNRDLYLYGAMLATFPLITLFFEFIDARFATLSEPQCVLLQVISQLPAMIFTIEFIWRINGLHDVWFKRLTYAAMAIFNIGVLVAFVPYHPSGLVSLALVGYRVTLQSFNVLTILANLWVIFVKRQRRLIAFAMMLVPSASLAEGFRNTAQSADLFDLAFFLSGFFLTAILAHQAWKEWRARDALQAEFEAARELQQRLVSPAVDVPGFRIESVYAPAQHVGGDFFYLRPEEDGAILVVVGDVSGKGLRAAMTVNSVMGALRTMPPLPPMRILADLNRGLLGQMQGGFVTCCAARVTDAGRAIIANAGHLAPYRNGEEVQLESGLPLGIAAGAEYSETTLQLEPGDRLTFMSDGVVEAQSATGELFGFGRTAAISIQSAESIAQAAQAHGQEDDITVLTVQFQGKQPSEAPSIGLELEGLPAEG